MATPADCLRRIAITALSAQVGSGGVSNFDVLLTRADLPDEMCSPTDGNRAQSDGGDISFASDEAGTTQLACDIIRWEYDSSDGAGDAVISVRVNVASLSSDSDTIFYGFYSTVGTSSQPAAGESFGQHATYHSSIASYWALEENPSGSAPQMLDRTSNANHGTSAGTMTSGDAVVAKVGNGLDFDGSDDRIDCGTDASLSPGDSFAIEAWVQSNAVGRIAVSKRSEASARFWELGFDNSGLALFRITANSNDFGAGTTDLRHASTMHYLAGDYDGSNKSTYVNASSVSTASMAGSADNSDAFEIGRRGHTSAEADWSGKIDEVRYSNVGRGPAYFTTRYNNESGTLLSIATPVTTAASGAGKSRSLILGLRSPLR